MRRSLLSRLSAHLLLGTLFGLFALFAPRPMWAASGPSSSAPAVQAASPPASVEPSAEFRFNASMKQAEYAFHSFETRRQFQWQFNIALWTALLVGVRFLDQKSARPPVWLGGLVLLSHAAWERGIWMANSNDKRLAGFFRRYAYDVMVDPQAPVPVTWPPKLNACQLEFWIGWLKDWSHLFEWTVTLTIVVGAHILLNRHPKVTDRAGDISAHPMRDQSRSGHHVASRLARRR